MTPTLVGRLQTRVALTVFVGVAWTLLVVPVAALGADEPWRLAYAVSFRALGLVLAFGLVWELGYHGLQQLRWERDWPTLFGLVTAANEGVVVYAVLRAGLAPDGEVSSMVFLIHFVTTWLAMWAVVNGPVKVVFPMWRFNGGRFW